MVDTLTPVPPEPSVIDDLRRWRTCRWWTAAGVAAMAGTAIPTAMIATPVFSRDVPTTAWAWPVLVVTSVLAALAGLAAATYVARRDLRGAP